MKRFLPYILSIMLGTIFGLFLFNKSDIKLNEIFSDSIKATGFQLGVFNDVTTAEELKKKYEPSIIIKDDDVYRVYYSILTNNKAVAKMEEYLNEKKIAFYKKELVIEDNSIIKNLNNYQSLILDGNDEVLVSVNKLVMNSYEGE